MPRTVACCNDEDYCNEYLDPLYVEHNNTQEAGESLYEQTTTCKVSTWKTEKGGGVTFRYYAQVFFPCQLYTVDTLYNIMQVHLICGKIM